MKFAGYLDSYEKGLERMATTWNGGGILYFLISEEGFQKLGLTEQVFRVDLEVEEEQESLLKAELAGIVSQYNREKGNVAQGSELMMSSDMLTLEASPMSWRQRETISPPAGSSWEPCAPFFS